jgi:hypothetical protein
MSVTLPPGATVVRTLRQQVPANAPAGTYAYAVKVGTLGGAVIASDGFPVVKEGAAARGAGEAAEWSWSEEAAAASATLPDGYALSEGSPNPFGAQTRLTLALSEGQVVRVEVYDGLGRRVAVLYDGEVEAGAHALTFDGSSLPAGAYVVRATGEAFSVARRVTLVR